MINDGASTTEDPMANWERKIGQNYLGKTLPEMIVRVPFFYHQHAECRPEQEQQRCSTEKVQHRREASFTHPEKKKWEILLKMNPLLGQSCFCLVCSLILCFDLLNVLLLESAFVVAAATAVVTVVAAAGGGDAMVLLSLLLLKLPSHFFKCQRGPVRRCPP